MKSLRERSASIEPRMWGWVVICAAVCPTPGCVVAEHSDGREETVGGRFHDSIVTLDSHAGFASDPLRTCGETARQVDIPKLRAGGMDIVFFSSFAVQRRRNAANYTRAVEEGILAAERIHAWVAQCDHEVGIARSPQEALTVVAQGKIAVAIGLENGFMLGPDLTVLDRYVALGASYVGLTHDGHNAIADAAVPLEILGDAGAEHGGVSGFGERVIAVLNQRGLLVDISHASRGAAQDVIRLSRAPVIASHSAMSGLNPHPRNIDDETLRALAAKGGVVQIPGVHEFLKVDPPGAMDAFYALLREYDLATDAEARDLPADQRAEFERRNQEMLERWPLATVIDLVDHVDYAVRLIGVDHVGIGSDFDGGAGLTGWAHTGESPNVTAELRRRGYTDGEIAKIWGGNFLRVWGEALNVATP